MSGPVYDQQLANAATAAQQCMTLGAVILNAPGKSSVGFHTGGVVPKDATLAIPDERR